PARLRYACWRRARRARTRRRRWDRRLQCRYGRSRSSLQTGSQLHQSTPDPALHGAKRHLHALGQLLIRYAVEKRRTDHRRMALLKLTQADFETRLLLGRDAEIERPPRLVTPA